VQVVSVVFESKDILNVCVCSLFYCEFREDDVDFNLHSFCCRNFGDKSFQDD